jgi:hypothetical protein
MLAIQAIFRSVMSVERGHTYTVGREKLPKV